MLLPLGDQPLETVELLRDPYVLSSRPTRGSPSGHATLREIVDEPLIGFRDCRHRRADRGALRSAGREPDFVFRTDENGDVQGLAGAGIGIAILPRLAVDAERRDAACPRHGTPMTPR